MLGCFLTQMLPGVGLVIDRLKVGSHSKQPLFSPRLPGLQTRCAKESFDFHMKPDFQVLAANLRNREN